MAKCAKCRGSGTVTCPVCHGAPDMQASSGDLPGCDGCDGDGKVKCPDCGGSGAVQAAAVQSPGAERIRKSFEC